MATATSTTSYHDRRLARRLEDPKYREHFERASREIATIDAIVNGLDRLREEHGMSKAELARRIEKNAASVRRLLTASGNPELRTVVAMADALDADVMIVPRCKSDKASMSEARRLRTLVEDRPARAVSRTPTSSSSRPMPRSAPSEHTVPANRLTPTELARETGLERRDIIVKCVELGVPIFNGRIDKTLFLSSLREQGSPKG